jgi:probable F420-dependent oxidoreductase
MKHGVVVAFHAGTPPDLIEVTARVAEEREFHSLWVPEHVIVFHEYASRYPYAADGRLPGGPVGLIDPFDALTYVAALTRRIRLGTGICLVPQRNPVYTAKHVADLDFLSGGRVDFGVGIGWLREEFEALGVPFEQRAARTRDYVELMKKLWTEETPSHDGPFHSVSECVFGPKPVQKPHPPVIFGGDSRAAFERAVDMGQGWYGYDLQPDEAAEPLAALDRLLAERGRSRDSFQIFVSPAFRRVDRSGLERYRDLGVDQVVIPLLAGDADGIERRGDQLAELVRGIE